MSEDKERLESTLKRIIEGYSIVSSISLSQRKECLSKLTPEASFKEYLNMYNFYLSFIKEGGEEIDKIKMAHSVKKRNILNVVGKIK